MMNDPMGVSVLGIGSGDFGSVTREVVLSNSRSAYRKMGLDTGCCDIFPGFYRTQEHCAKDEVMHRDRHI